MCGDTSGTLTSYEVGQKRTFARLNNAFITFRTTSPSASFRKQMPLLLKKKENSDQFVIIKPPNYQRIPALEY